jgi:hypothetical protein
MKWPQYAPEDEPRKAFQNRPTAGKTTRKLRFKTTGRQTNVGDPNNKKQSGGGPWRAWRGVATE